MQVFVSWSGPRSKAVAIATKKWLEKALSRTQRLFSEKDIEAGSRWHDEISKSLERCDFGVICVTPENMEKPWLLFESGALAKKVEAATRVVPYILDMNPTQLNSSPLSAFQAKRVDKPGTRDLVDSINSNIHLERRPDVAFMFDMLWQSGWKDELSASAIGEPESPVPPKPKTDEVLEAIYAGIKDLANTTKGIGDTVHGIRIQVATLGADANAFKPTRTNQYFRSLKAPPEPKKSKLTEEEVRRAIADFRASVPASAFENENLIVNYVEMEWHHLSSSDRSELAVRILLNG